GWAGRGAGPLAWQWTSCLDSSELAQHALDHVVGTERKASVVAHGREPLRRHAGLEQQQRAELPVPVLFDDEVQLVLGEEFGHRLAEREATYAHVVECYALVAQPVHGL